MTLLNLKDKFGIYFDTFWFINNTFDKRDLSWFHQGEKVTKHGYLVFLSYVKSLKNFLIDEKAKIKAEDQKYFHIINGEARCPICNGKVYRSPEVMLPRHPIFTYYCHDCNYSILSILVPKEVTMDEELLKRMRELDEEYNKTQEQDSVKKS